jgi:hypothetical protein
MTGADKVVCHAATLLLLFTLTTGPARAQFGGFGGAGGGDMMTQMAPMLNVMKAKMGKRRFGAMMQTMGPMMSRMMQNGGGGFDGMLGGGGIPGGFGGGTTYAADSHGTSMGGGGFTGMLGGGGGSELMSMIPQVMQMVNFGGGHRHRRHRRH